MRGKVRHLRLFSAIAALILFSASLRAQAPASVRTAANAGLLTGQVTDLVTLKGNRHPLASAENDRGEVNADLPMKRMLLVLRPSDEAGLRKMIAEQQDRSSPRFHAWLSPEEFGERFGAAKSDLQTVRSWLEARGFEVNRVARGGLTIEFSGNAGQVKNAFQTAIHSYLVEGARHYANASDPQIPAALAQVVAGVSTLHNFEKPSPLRVLGTATRVANSSKWQPQFTYPGPAGTFHYVAPGDFSRIYNTAPLYKSGTDGTGQSIAIVGRSNILLSDIQIFRLAFGLAVNDPQIIVDGPDPGNLTGSSDETEADLDVEWSGAVAPNATIKFVVSASTNTTDGVDLSSEYIVDNDLAPILSTSFGECESALGTQNTFYNNLWAQAAAEGITAIVASGDAGEAGCDSPYSGPATKGAAVSGLASTPFNVAVGGTQFNENGADSSYWSATNGTDQTSVLGYIPEEVWNESCSDPTQCLSITLFASSGGTSSLYAKPSWQVAPGVPSDLQRDVPDVSLAAAAQHDGYLLCQDGTCLTGSQGELVAAEVVGGTSAAAPTFAGIMALVVQSTQSRQGQADFVLYPLAAAQNDGNCNASGPPQSGCIFNDITQGNNSVPGQAGASAAPGYDLATGLGSVNAANLVAQWGTIALRSTTTTLAVSPATIVHGQPVTATVNVSPVSGGGGGTPTGEVALLTGGTVGLLAGSLTSGSLASVITTLPGGSYTATASYAGDGTFAPSTSSGVAVTVNPEPSTLTVVPSPVAITYSQVLDLQASVAGASAQGIATGTVTFLDAFNGNTGTLVKTSLNSQGNLDVPETALAIGTHQISAMYSGDSSFQASSAGPFTISVTKGASQVLLFVPGGALPNSPVILQTIVFPANGADFPTGTVQFFAGGAALGPPVPITGEVETLVTTKLTNGQNSISATYSGDSNFTGSSATQNVYVGTPNFQIGVNPGDVTVSSTTPGTVKVLLSPGPGIGFAGNVTFSCSGQPTGTTCSYLPATVALDGFNPQTTTLTISAGAGSSAIPMLARSAAGIGLACVVLFGLPGRRRSRLWSLVILFAGLAAAMGCGAGSSSQTSTATGSSYVLVITATGGTGSSAVSNTVSLSVSN